MVTRRQLLGAVTGLSLVRAQAGISEVFPQGVASGDPSDSGAVLWTRVAPQAFRSGQRLSLQIAASPDFASLVHSQTLEVLPSNDYTVQAEVSGVLEAGNHYYYRFGYGGVNSPTGRTKILPKPGQQASVRLGMVSCQEYSSGFYGAYGHLAKEDLDAVLHLGDFIYEFAPDPRFGRQRFAGRTFSLPSGSSVALGLADYRRLYQGYRDPQLQAAMAAHPFLLMWDDHEFANDGYWDPALQAPGAPNHPYRSDPQRLRQLRQDANRAWREYVPSRLPPAGALQMPTYRSFRFGEWLELFLTDTRSFRSPHPCGPDQRTINNCAAAASSKQTILGSDQMQWLLEGLSRSQARWRGLGSAVMFSPLTAFNTPLNLDGWDGYTHERNQILQAVGPNPNLLVLSGDLHSALAARLTPQFAGGTRLGMEFMAPSISSPPAKESLSSRFPWPGNGAVEWFNPWLEFFDGETNGYAILEVSQQSAIYELYAVDRSRADAPKRLVRRVVYKL